MNGGTYKQGEEKIRPGFYTLFESAAKERSLVGERGVTALPIELGWGESKKFIEINDDRDVQKKLGLDPNDPSLTLLNLARDWAKTVLLYRINSGKKAEATLEVEAAEEEVKVTAVYGGKKGNEIRVKVNTNVIDEEKKDVITYVGTRAIDKQTVSDASELVNNDMVDFSGSGKLKDAAGVVLSGGDEEEVTNLDYTEFLEAAETEYFDTIALPVDDDEELKTTFASFVKRMREDLGVYFAGVMPNYKGDYDGILNVTNGLVFGDNRLSIAESTAWAAGASAGATIYQDLTFVEVEGATDVYPRFDNDEIEDRIEAGEFMFTYDPRDKVVSVEMDINSLTTFTDTKNKRFRNNKIIRILDGMANDLKRESRHVIKQLKEKGSDLAVNDDGKQILSSLYSVYFTKLQENGAIKNFDASDDIIITEVDTDDGDSFEIEMYVQPVSSARKLYNKFIVK